MLSVSAGAAAAAPLSIFVSVLPLQTFVETVGGDRVETRAMVQPGHSPATYDPSPQQVAALADADLYVRVGVPFENAWMKRIRAANPDMPVLDLRDGLTQVPIEHEGKTPGARRLTALIEQARAADTRVIFVQPQFDRSAATRVAQSIGGRVKTVDPLAADYAANLRRVARLIAEANSEGEGSGAATAGN